ncbi:MAG: hypothetical protein ACKOYC_10465 [Bacteroidota bacterium]
MKTFLLITLLLFNIGFNVPAQTPQAIPYQATTLNAAGQPLANHPIAVRFSILDSTISGDVLYKELHTISTNALGLFTANIGQGSPISGTFNTINWAANNKFLKVELDTTGGGTMFTDLGTQQLLSVPYALHAKNGIDRISVNGDTLFLSNGDMFLSSNGNNAGSGLLVFPNVQTSVLSVGSNRAKISLGVSNVNPGQILSCGLVWSINSNPVYDPLNLNYSSCSNNFITFGALPGTYEYSITDINCVGYPIPGEELYVRGFAITENNLCVYGEQLTVLTTTIGQAGPAGGTVFFDKGDTIGGWRYLEVAPWDQSANSPWGCVGLDIFPQSLGLASTDGFGFDVGSGEALTDSIVTQCGDPVFAAKVCADLVLGGLDDWFLPTLIEADFLNQNLANTSNPFNLFGYWTSWESFQSPNDAYYVATPNSGNGLATKNSLKPVRAIRKY